MNECGYLEDVAYAAIDVKTSYTVVVESEDGVERDLISFDTAKEATDFCEQHNWWWVDENNFHWEMCIRNNRI